MRVAPSVIAFWISLVILHLKTTAQSYNFPVTINVYPISPLAGHIYPANQTLPIAIAIDNAIAAFTFGFQLYWSVNGTIYSPTYPFFEPQDNVGSGSFIPEEAAFPSNPLFVYTSATSMILGEGNWTFTWSWEWTTCAVEPTVIILTEGPLIFASIPFFVDYNGTVVPEGEGGSPDTGSIQLNVAGNISCPSAVVTSIITPNVTTPILSPPTRTSRSSSSATGGAKTGGKSDGNRVQLSASDILALLILALFWNVVVFVL